MVDVKGYEGLYKVEKSGMVHSLYTHNQHYNGKNILKQHKNKAGYLYVRLFKDGKSKNCLVHRLVAEAFIPKPDYKCEVNHKNGIKSNCDTSNLEWVTHQENIQHSINTGLRKPKQKVEWWNWNQEQFKAFEQSGALLV